MIYSDFPINYGKSFQDYGSYQQLSIIDLHNTIIYYLIILFTIVFWLFLSSQDNQKDHKFNLLHNNTIELIWTILPTKILWFIGLPSLELLYIQDEIIDPEITIKVIGNQWYWSYEYTDYDNIKEFDSFKINEEDLELGELRQLTVDNNLKLPINTSIRLIITANDVLHSFAIPSLGLKMDAIPGRLNSTGLFINRLGNFYGQCSELCGTLHSSMPICIEALNLSDYLIWCKD